MKTISKRVAITLLLCALSFSAASAKVKSRNLTFGQDFIVGGTTVKAGTYRLSFDDEKNEIVVSEKKSGRTVAKSQARAEARQTASNKFDVQFVETAGTQTLASVAFEGEKQLITVGATTARQK